MWVEWGVTDRECGCNLMQLKTATGLERNEGLAKLRQ